MRCECCNNPLSDVDATAKFEDGRFVGMCRKCRGFLPPDIVVKTRPDLDNTVPVDDDGDSDYFFDEDDYGYDDE